MVAIQAPRLPVLEVCLPAVAPRGVARSSGAHAHERLGEVGKLDVVAVSYLANILNPPIETPLKETVKKWPNLVSFTDRALKDIYGA